MLIVKEIENKIIGKNIENSGKTGGNCYLCKTGQKMHKLIEKHYFNGNEFEIEINFTEVLDSYGNYDIVRVTGSEGMATSDYMNQVVRDNYGRNQLQKRMEAFIENQQKQKK